MIGFNCLSAVLLIYLATIISPFAWSDPRAGVMYPEDQQRQAAVLAATGLGESDGLPAAAMESLLNESSRLTINKPSIIEQKIEANLEPVSLEEQVVNQRLADELELFGYEIFTGIPTTFAPVEGIPVPSDYIVGPGDVFTLQMFGAADLQYTLTVTREGVLLVPEVGDLAVAGMTFSEVKEFLQKKISETRVGARVVATLSKLQTMQVMLVGEVVQPGTYTVSGLSTLLNTLVSAGGIKRSGSLRNIEVLRGGVKIATFDLYELLLFGKTVGNVYLRQGDVVFIPSIGDVVSIAGEVKRPAIYEIKAEETVSQLLDLAGGLLPSAAKDKAQIERVNDAGGYSLLDADLTTQGLFMPIKAGDLVRIYPVVNRMQNVVLLSGNVLTPGGFEWYEGIRVSNILGGLEYLKQRSDLSVGIIEREDRQKKRISVEYFSVGNALASPGGVSDVLLKPRDKVTVLDTHSERSEVMKPVVTKIRQQTPASELAPVIEFRGDIRHPGFYPLQTGHRLLDAVEAAGGIKAGVIRDYVILTRTHPINRRVELITLNLDNAIKSPSGDHNPRLKPGDSILFFDVATNRSSLLTEDLEKLRQQARYGQPVNIVRINGPVKHPGEYPLTAGMRVKDLIVAAGGMLEDAFGISATIARKNAIAGEVLSTDELKINFQGENSVFGDLNTILEPYDHLMLRQKPNWNSSVKKIQIAGEVRFPGTYEVSSNDTMCALVRKAGGFMEDAYLFGAVFTRESVRKREQEALDRINRQLDDLLADVYLSPGYQKDTKMPINQSTLDTYRIIQQLKPERAIGRMVIDLQRSGVECDEVADFKLEDGDSLYVPKYLDEVSVVGQVYFPSSHKFSANRGAYDYINLSGGTKELAQREHAFIVQANGEVMSARSKASTWGGLLSPRNLSVTPGSTIYVPMSVDRINDREFTESWIDLVYKLTLSAASVDFLFGR